jgi:integrase
MLTDTACKNAKPREKPYKLSDEKGMYLEVMPNGSKYFRMKYRFGGKEKRLAFGVYPETGLKDARDKRDEARKSLAQGIDPSAERKAAKDAQAGADSFEAIAREWLAKNERRWAETTHRHIKDRLEINLFPWIGARPIAEITARELLAALNKTVERGRIDTAQRVKADSGRVFSYAVATGRAERNPTADLAGALPTAKAQHRATIIEPWQVGELLRAIDAYTGTFVVRAAFKLAPLLFLRPGELVQAEWAEFDLEAGEWRIPGERMKMGGRHIVPLPRQAVEVLRELHALTGAGRYVFPGVSSKKVHMSRESIRAALIRMGYGPDSETPMTAHGFRGMASTLLHEQGWNSDVIERQLAHAERNKIKAAYNHAEHLPERRRMMQAWADYLDGLKAGAQVIPIRRAG